MDELLEECYSVERKIFMNWSIKRLFMKEKSGTCRWESGIVQKLRKNKKNILSAVFFVLLALLTFYAICKGNDMEKVAEAIRRMDVRYFIGAVALGLFFVSAEGIMIWYLLRPLDDATRFFKCIKYSFIGFFYSGITPSATGGQPMQLYHMNKDGLRVSESTVVLLTVAVIYKFVLVVMGLLMLVLGYGSLREYLGEYIWLFYLGLFLNTALVVILLIVIFRPGLFKSIVFHGEKFLVKLHILKHSAERLEKLAGFADRYHATVKFYLKNKRKIAVVVGFTVIQRLSVFFLTYLVYRGFHLSGTSALSVMMVQASVYIAVDMLPLPGAQGITELMYKSVFAGIFPGSLLTASMCVSRGINFYFLLIFSALLTFGCYIIGRILKRKQST